MLKFYKLFLSQTSQSLRNYNFARFISDFSFDSNDEIITNSIDKVKLIGMNLPETKNVLTEKALRCLRDYILNFDDDDNYSCGILHGSGGNFCTGIERTETAKELSQEILKVLNSLKKPIIGSLNGYTTNYGLHLAVMCDIRVMEVSGIVGLNESAGKIKIQPFVRERLVWSVGPAKTLELLGTKQSWFDNQVLTNNFITRLVEPGCALGQSLIYANSLSFNSSLENLVEEKSKILSCLTIKR